MPISTSLTFVAYLVLMFIMAWISYRLTQSMSDYILGGRRLGAAVTAMSAGASDMSAWLLLGLPGAVYLGGLKEAWIVVGLCLGAWANWYFLASRLRTFSEQQNDAITLPEVLARRFPSSAKTLRSLSAFIILGFFTFYAASGLVAGAKLFATTLGMDYDLALLLGASIILFYTVAGGFLAVSWTDFIQAIIMLFALLVVPLEVIWLSDSSLVERFQASSSTHLDVDIKALALVSLLAWGLGYFGQPHILTRFMAIRETHQLKRARRIAMSWMILTLLGALGVGLLGFLHFFDSPTAQILSKNSESVFILLTKDLLNPWISGVVLAAILAAVMSTIDSQLLVASSAVSHDFYQTSIRPEAGEKELLWVGRASLAAISILALIIASDPENKVLSLVSYAWAGCGAAFGPVLLFGLYWSKMSDRAAVSGLVVGAITVLIWKQLSGGIFDIYELLPGFILASVSIVTVSLIFPSDAKQLEDAKEQLSRLS